MEFFKYDDDSARKAHQNYLVSGDQRAGGVRDEILLSWKRCTDLSVNPFSERSSAQDPGFKPDADLLCELSYMRTFLNVDFALDFYKFLRSINAAFVMTDLSLNIIAKRGSDIPLEQLNWEIGSNLAERYMGTNAAALAKHMDMPCTVVGAEHFCKKLQPYVTVAIPRIGRIYSMIIADVNHYSPFLLRYVHLYSSYVDTRCVLEEIQLASTVYFEQKDDHQGKILVNQIGKIININQAALERLRLSQDAVCNQRLEAVIPELKGMLAPFNENKISHSEIKVGGQMFFVCRQLVQKSSSGVAVILFTLEHKGELKRRKKQDALEVLPFSALIGRSPKFLEVKKMATRLSQSQSNVLIYGESGSGKDLFARAIHDNSPRKKGPFISLNCAALPKDLVSSELFGYAEGAFTGARKGGAVGKFELADGGTLFLDEIAEMPLEMQSLLLRVLEEKRVTRLGGERPRSVDVRIVGATNKNLVDAVEKGSFRLDLFYRLSVTTLELPPLRERKEDIPLLADFFFNQYNAQFQINLSGFSPEAMACLEAYHWPGNVRELRNVVERAFNFACSDRLTLADLPERLQVQAGEIKEEPGTDKAEDPMEEKERLEATEEKKLLKNTLGEHAGDKNKAAIALGISRATLYRKLKKYNLVKWNKYPY